MCLGVPGLIVQREAGDTMTDGLVEFAGVRRRVCLACVPEAQVGDYVIVHAGIAISRIDPVEAQRVFAYLDQIGGDDGWVGDLPTQSG